jgi:hypothetical protein
LLIYSRKGEKATVTGIPNGAYRIYSTTGEDWDSGAKTLARRCYYDVSVDTPQIASTGTIEIEPAAVDNPGGMHDPGGLDPADFPV